MLFAAVCPPFPPHLVFTFISGPSVRTVLGCWSSGLLFRPCPPCVNGLPPSDPIWRYGLSPPPPVSSMGSFRDTRLLCIQRLCRSPFRASQRKLSFSDSIMRLFWLWCGLHPEGPLFLPLPPSSRPPPSPNGRAVFPSFIAFSFPLHPPLPFAFWCLTPCTFLHFAFPRLRPIIPPMLPDGRGAIGGPSFRAAFFFLNTPSFDSNPPLGLAFGRHVHFAIESAQIF